MEIVEYGANGDFGQDPKRHLNLRNSLCSKVLGRPDPENKAVFRASGGVLGATARLDAFGQDFSQPRPHHKALTAHSDSVQKVPASRDSEKGGPTGVMGYIPLQVRPHPQVAQQPG
jgi:hypothetical protein